MKKFFKVLFVSLFLSSCLFGSVYATSATFSCEAVSSAIIGNVSEAERRGESDARLDCRNHKINRNSIKSRNPYSSGSREYKAYQNAYNRVYKNCKKAR